MSLLVGMSKYLGQTAKIYLNWISIIVAQLSVMSQYKSLWLYWQFVLRWTLLLCEIAHVGPVCQSGPLRPFVYASGSFWVRQFKGQITETLCNGDSRHMGNACNGSIHVHVVCQTIQHFHSDEMAFMVIDKKNLRGDPSIPQIIPANSSTHFHRDEKGNILGWLIPDK